MGPVEEAAFKARIAQIGELADDEARRAALRELLQDLTAPVEDEPLVPLGELLPKAFDLMDRRADKLELPIETPWPDLNEQLPGGGYFAGCHVLVSGTGVGKTTFAQAIILHTALKRKIPCAPVGLEIDAAQTALRYACDLADVPWARAYTGQVNADERRRIRQTLGELGPLPIYPEFGDAMGWPASRLAKLARRMRKAHPEGPMLIVVDFLQLVGSEEGATRQDLRERIGQAAYQARMVASKLNVTVLLISSVARDSYTKVSGIEALKLAGFDIDEPQDKDDPSKLVVDRFMRAPETLVGLGKESGEIEFAADSVTAAITLPKENGGERPVVFAIAKLRAGPPGWCSLLFNGTRFRTDPTHGRGIIDKLNKPKDDDETDNTRGEQNKSSAPRLKKGDT